MFRIIHSLRKHKGQAMVEFVLVFLILVIIALGIAQFSMILSVQIAVTNAAREGARAAAVKTPMSDVQTIVLNSIGGHVFRDTSLTPTVTISPSSYSGMDAGDSITVTLTNVRVKAIVPVPSFDNFAPGTTAIIEKDTPFVLSGTSTMRYEYRP